MLPALLLIVVTTSFPSFKRVLVGDVKLDDDMDHSKDPAMPAIDEDQTAHHAIDVSLDPEEEDLEEVIVQNMEHALRRIHRVEHRCERKHGTSRHQSRAVAVDVSHIQLAHARSIDADGVDEGFRRVDHIPIAELEGLVDLS